MVCNKFVVCELGRGGCRLTLHDSATRHRLRVTELWFFVRSHAGLCELYATAPADLLERREPRDLDLEPPCSPIPLAGIEPPSEPLSEDGWQQALASKLVLRWAGRAPDKGRGQREASKSSNDERAKDPGRGRQYSWQEGLAQRVVLNLAAGLAPTASPEAGGEEHIVEPCLVGKELPDSPRSSGKAPSDASLSVEPAAAQSPLSLCTFPKRMVQETWDPTVRGECVSLFMADIALTSWPETLFTADAHDNDENCKGTPRASEEFSATRLRSYAGSARMPHHAHHLLERVSDTVTDSAEQVRGEARSRRGWITVEWGAVTAHKDKDEADVAHSQSGEFEVDAMVWAGWVREAVVMHDENDSYPISSFLPLSLPPPLPPSLTTPSLSPSLPPSLPLASCDDGLMETRQEQEDYKSRLHEEDAHGVSVGDVVGLQKQAEEIQRLEREIALVLMSRVCGMCG